MSSFFLTELSKLKNIQTFLEKNDNLINCLSKYGAESDLSNYYLQTEKDRNAGLEHLTNEIKTLWNMLEAKKKTLKEDIHNLDLKTFKKDLITIQDKIFDMKSKLNINIQLLKYQEKDLDEEIEIYNHKIEEWEKPIKYFSSINYKINGSITSTHSNNSKEVKEFMDFINKSNGYENGWSSNDHQLFLKLRSKYKHDIENLAINLNRILPDISLDDVKQHELWYRKYLELKFKKDEALEKWRQSKNENQQTKSNENDNNASNVIKHATSKSVDKSVQEKIAMWKAEREAKRQQEYIYEQMRNERLKQIEAEKKKLHEEVKQSVAKWREAKLIKEKQEKIKKQLIEQQERKIRAAEANKLIKQFQTHDDIFIMKMRSKKISEKHEIRRTQSSYMVNRDPQRLMKPTKQWLLRTSKDNFMDNESPNPVPNLQKIPKLRIPDWRKNCRNC